MNFYRLILSIYLEWINSTCRSYLPEFILEGSELNFNQWESTLNLIIFLHCIINIRSGGGANTRSAKISRQLIDFYQILSFSFQHGIFAIISGKSLIMQRKQDCTCEGPNDGQTLYISGNLLSSPEINPDEKGSVLHDRLAFYCHCKSLLSR